MTNVATYQNISDNIPEDQRWLAYIILPTGDFWHVRFNGPTAEIAKEKAISRWAKENAKWDRLGLNKKEPEEESDLTVEPNPMAPVDPWNTVLTRNGVDNNQYGKFAAPSGRGHHFAGKVWMRNADGLKRVALTEIALYEKNGYWRSSPRGK